MSMDTEYGPNSAAVKALIERAGKLTAEEARALAGVRSLAVATDVWDTAWDEAYAVLDREVQVWSRAAGMAALARLPEPARDALSVLLDAAMVLVVRHLIPPEHFDTIYGPWARVIGEEAGT